MAWEETGGGARSAPVDDGWIVLPADALVMLVGPSGSGKSWWAQTHFRDTCVVSSDRCRALVADDETDQSVNPQAFRVFHEIIRQRLALGRLTVADSTALSPFARARLRETAAQAGRPVHVVAVCTPPALLLRNNRQRERRVPEEVLERHAREFAALLDAGILETEGYDAVHYLRFPPTAVPRLVPPGRTGPATPARAGDRPRRPR